jgi:hypothetical protein
LALVALVLQVEMGFPVLTQCLVPSLQYMVVMEQGLVRQVALVALQEGLKTLLVLQVAHQAKVVTVAGLHLTVLEVAVLAKLVTSPLEMVEMASHPVLMVLLSLEAAEEVAVNELLMLMVMAVTAAEAEEHIMVATMQPLELQILEAAAAEVTVVAALTMAKQAAQAS